MEREFLVAESVVLRTTPRTRLEILYLIGNVVSSARWGQQNLRRNFHHAAISIRSTRGDLQCDVTSHCPTDDAIAEPPERGGQGHQDTKLRRIGILR